MRPTLGTEATLEQAQPVDDLIPAPRFEVEPLPGDDSPSSTSIFSPFPLLAPGADTLPFSNLSHSFEILPTPSITSPLFSEQSGPSNRSKRKRTKHPAAASKPRPIYSPPIPSINPLDDGSALLDPEPDEAVDFGADPYEIGSAFEEDNTGDLTHPLFPHPTTSSHINASQKLVNDYAEMLFVHKAAYIARIDNRCWVVEDTADDMPCLGQFCHITLYEGATSAGVETLATCDCSMGKDGLNCLHVKVMLQEKNRFKEELQLSQRHNPVAIQIASHLHGRRAWFSVLSTRSTIQVHSQDGKRCIVALVGSRLWTCSASHCSAPPQDESTCVHRQKAHRFWTETLGLDNEEGKDEGESEESDSDDLQRMATDVDSIRAHVQLRPCSHLPIPPPPFCRLPFEPIPPPSIDPRCLPDVLPLGDHSRCDCGRLGSNNESIRLRSCTIYFSTGAFSRTIQTQECDCRRGTEKRSIGPDLSNFGLFNWNNAVVVSHELFNAYSSQLSASPTPLTAFCTTIQHAYEQHQPAKGLKFMARSTFIKLYFAYVSLQKLEVAFSCPQCGPTPSIIIADGVVLAYSTSLQHANLAPPTMIGSDPDINERARPAMVIPFLANVRVRTAARTFAQCLVGNANNHIEAMQDFSAGLESGEGTMPITMRLWARHLKQLMLDICLSVTIEHSLKVSLSHLISELAANEGILQLCRPLCQPLFVQVSAFNLSSSTKEHFIQLSTTISRHCPAFGNVLLLLGHQLSSASTHTLLNTLQLLIGTTSEAISYQMALLNPRPPPVPSSPSIMPDDYRHTGSLYGAPRCRTRPAYPRLDEGKGGNGNEKQAIKEGGDQGVTICRKYYDEYVKRQRTGGIMALWCTHCICVGFHVIPQAEGRNDVFSAIFSHWPSPPSVVVYDFACQLGPYALRREPGFFKDTLFVVDQMHEKGHTHCSASSRLSTYMRNDPKLQHIYSSAAECGNSGLARIKKSISYCKQEHAVALVRVFLSIWNRRRMRT